MKNLRKIKKQATLHNNTNPFMWGAVACMFGAMVCGATFYFSMVTWCLGLGFVFCMMGIFCWWDPSERVLRMNTFFPSLLLTPTLCTLCRCDKFPWEFEHLGDYRFLTTCNDCIHTLEKCKN